MDVLSNVGFSLLLNWRVSFDLIPPGLNLNRRYLVAQENAFVNSSNG
jgi:hypothetical protein